MTEYCIYVRTGSRLTMLQEAPAFVDRDEAERYAQRYWLEHPELMVKGIRAVEVHECFLPPPDPEDE
jgi:hypothetical protein